MPIKIKEKLVPVSFKCSPELSQELQLIKSLQKQHTYIDYDLNEEASSVLLKRFKSDRKEMEKIIAKYNADSSTAITTEPAVSDSSYQSQDSFPTH